MIASIFNAGGDGVLPTTTVAGDAQYEFGTGIEATHCDVGAQLLRQRLDDTHSEPGCLWKIEIVREPNTAVSNRKLEHVVAPAGEPHADHKCFLELIP